MPTKHAPRWLFTSRFRRHTFGYKSSKLAISRLKQAVSEIKGAGRTDAIAAAEGAILLLEKLSPALEQVDSSSGALGTAVGHALAELVPIIRDAPADERTRRQWIDRLLAAYYDDKIPYIEALGDFMGELCGSPDLASEMADETLRLACGHLSGQLGGYYPGTSVCLSALLMAGRYEEILAMLATAKHIFWHYREFGVRALAKMGRTDEAIAYAEASCGLNDSPREIERTCEEILLAAGRDEEAYARYALTCNGGGTYLATLRAILKKYPKKEPRQVLMDLAKSTPGEEGKWFAAAKELGLRDLAIELAQHSPTDPKTLNRAARDYLSKDPHFALRAALASLAWIARGYGYELTGADIWTAHELALQAARALGLSEQVREQLLTLYDRIPTLASLARPLQPGTH